MFDILKYHKSPKSRYVYSICNLLMVLKPLIADTFNMGLDVYVGEISGFRTLEEFVPWLQIIALVI